MDHDKQATLTEEDRKHIAAATQEMVNAGVLRQLARLVQQWKEEEVLLRKAAFMVLGLLAVAILVAGLWFATLVLPR